MAKKKKKKQTCPAGERWAVPYADFLSLLLALFIALWAISKVNVEKLKSIKTEFIRIFDYPPQSSLIMPMDVRPIPQGQTDNTGATTPQTQNGSQSEAATSQEMQNAISHIQSVTQLIGGSLEEGEFGVVLRLPADVLFDKGQAKLRDLDDKEFLREMAMLISTLPKDIQVSVQGYTDNSPLGKAASYSDNLELSAQRALTIARNLIADGINPSLVSVTGYGQYKPLAPNNSEENRAKNRRVDIRLHFVNSDKKGTAKKPESVLDTVKDTVIEEKKPLGK